MWTWEFFDVNHIYCILLPSAEGKNIRNTVFTPIPFLNFFSRNPNIDQLQLTFSWEEPFTNILPKKGRNKRNTSRVNGIEMRAVFVIKNQSDSSAFGRASISSVFCNWAINKSRKLGRLLPFDFVVIPACGKQNKYFDKIVSNNDSCLLYLKKSSFLIAHKYDFVFKAKHVIMARYRENNYHVALINWN